ncbi:MAG: hypothetical protein A4S14_21000 [Proteobacteria bacterium SG_bin9]|nr:MAG: hypothetical protein A4S14_21000 [Proteobacteria bacterium SG_bin9]
MISRSLARALTTSALLAAGVVLAGCDSETLQTNAKALRPIPDKLVAEIQKKDMDTQSPMLVRLFKQESELEVWKLNRSGQYDLLKTYPICRWSGDLGPKVKEGDRQAPEGFYNITPAQMNPQSQFYLAFNMGYPNAFDKALGRTGSQLMVHGDCSSRGCYAMTDEQITEIYALGRESFFGGQRAFQVQAYPFRMTPQNMAKHRGSPHMPFWRMIKQGYDHFEVTRQEPKVDVCDKRYVFDAQQPANSTKPLNFRPEAACPAYEIPAEIADAVRDKQRQDEVKTAELISRGTPTARSRAGIDGGMHPVFANKLPNSDQIAMPDKDTAYAVASYSSAPGTIPSHVNPPRSPDQPAPLINAMSPTGESEPYVAVPAGAARAAAPATVTASAKPTAPAPAAAEKPGFFASMAERVGLRSAPEPKPLPPAPTPAQKKDTSKLVASKPAAPPAPKPAVAAADKPASTQSQQATAPAQSSSQQSIAGAQPVVQGSSFESRWTNFR